MTTTALCLLLLLAARQDGDAPRPALLDGVAIQAGEGLVTLSELERSWNRVFERQPAASREEEAQVRALVLRQLWEDSLEKQMGRDLGIDPALIQRNSQLSMRREREESGLSTFLERIESSGRDAFQAESDRENDVYQYLWRSTKTGGGVAGRRPAVDRFIRPGELHLIYRENLANLAPVQIQLQVLVVPSRAAGGVDQALQTCLEARRRVEAGEDFGLLVEEFGAELRETRGLTPLVPLLGIPDARLREWAGTAQIGGFSDPMPLVDRSGRPDPALGQQIVMLADRQVPPVPEFDDQSLQSNLRAYVDRRQEQQILERARRDLRAEAFGWVNPLLRPLLEGPGAPAPEQGSPVDPPVPQR